MHTNSIWTLFKIKKEEVRNSLFSLQCSEPECLCIFKKLVLGNHHWDFFSSRMSAIIDVQVKPWANECSQCNDLSCQVLASISSAWEQLVTHLECNSWTISKIINGNVAQIFEEPRANADTKWGVFFCRINENFSRWA